MDLQTQTPQLDQLSHQVGELIHNWGFKRIHGRIWTRLFLSSRPLDAADLIQQLDISKALVSISLRELLEVKAVEEVGRSARGTNLFRANKDLNAIYLEVLDKRERKMLESTSAALSTLANLDAAVLNQNEISPTQLGSLAGHLQMAMAMLNGFVKPKASAPTTEGLARFSVTNSSGGMSTSQTQPQTQTLQSALSQATSVFNSLPGGVPISMALPARGG
jgi:DNA-binding transcriptional regulator GbsR (MarR family)